MGRYNSTIILCLSLLGMLGSFPSESAENQPSSQSTAEMPVVSLRVKSFIDGKQILLVHRNALTWIRKDSAPGVDAQSHPTYISTLANGSPVLDNYSWDPRWISPVRDAPKIKAHSITCSKLQPELPKKNMAVSSRSLARSTMVRVVQEPNEANNYTSAIEFSGLLESGPNWQEAEITFSPPKKGIGTSKKQHTKSGQQIMLMPEDCPEKP